eukprot:COSAG03_NODE_3349_length_2065_cov_4.387080_4_plen_142_part_00
MSLVEREQPDRAEPEPQPEPESQPQRQSEPQPEPQAEPEPAGRQLEHHDQVMSRAEALEVLGLSAGASLEDIEKATKRQARRNRRRPAQIAAISDAAVALNCEWCLPQIHVEVASAEWAEFPTPVSNKLSLVELPWARARR